VRANGESQAGRSEREAEREPEQVPGRANGHGYGHERTANSRIDRPGRSYVQALTGTARAHPPRG
jgi:hypothetical protein